MNAVEIHLPTEEEKQAALDEFCAAMRKQDVAAASIQGELPAAVSQIIDTIQIRCGASYKLASLVWSLWNGEHVVGLWDCLAGLDTHNGEAILTLIRARLVLGGDADPAIRQILEESGEMDRYREAERQTPLDKPVPYPLPTANPQRLRELADALDEHPD